MYINIYKRVSVLFSLSAHKSLRLHTLLYRDPRACMCVRGCINIREGVLGPAKILSCPARFLTGPSHPRNGGRGSADPDSAWGFAGSFIKIGLGRHKCLCSCVHVCVCVRMCVFVSDRPTKTGHGGSNESMAGAGRRRTWTANSLSRFTH
jgi:hypothetical protein